MLQLDRIRVSYAGQVVLNDLSCQIKAGEIVSLLGSLYLESPGIAAVANHDEEQPESAEVASK